MVFKILDHQARKTVLCIQLTHIQPSSCLFSGMLKKKRLKRSQNSDCWWCRNTLIPSCIWKNACHPHSCTLEERFCFESQANNWYLSGKSLGRDNHFPWGYFFPSGLNMGWWSFSSRWAFCLTAVHRWLTSWLLIMEGLSVNTWLISWLETAYA